MPAIGSHIEFTWSVGPGLAAVILAAAGAGVAIIVALYRRESRRRVVPARVGRVLMALRALIIATTALILLGPASILVEEQYALPPLVVLRDASQSMSVADRYERSDQREAIAGLVGASTPPGETIEVPRHELVDHLLGRNGAELLREIAAVTRPRLVDFATSSNPTLPSTT